VTLEHDREKWIPVFGIMLHQLEAGSGRFGSVLVPSTAVTRGLDPRVHLLRIKLVRKKMDCRVKPGNDGRDCGATALNLFNQACACRN
jgi:hypothetical protein